MDKFFIEKAKIELREDELRKSQSLAHFKDWIRKHPFLSRIEYDDKHLLKFLRASKYNMDRAFTQFEGWYLAPKMFPKFFEITKDDIDRAEKLIRSGICVPLRGRCKNGEKVLVVRHGHADTDVFSPTDGFRAICDVAMTLLEEEETQIAGFIYIGDSRDVQLKHFMLPGDMLDVADFIKNRSSLRLKAHLIINLPSLANIVVETFMSVFSEKLKKRYFVLKSTEELKNFIDADLLPKEYGGSVPMQEMLDEFLDFRSKQKFSMKTIWNADVDWEKVPKDRIRSDGEESFGSFRKLEID